MKNHHASWPDCFLFSLTKAAWETATMQELLPIQSWTCEVTQLFHTRDVVVFATNACLWVDCQLTICHLLKASDMMLAVFLPRIYRLIFPLPRVLIVVISALTLC